MLASLRVCVCVCVRAGNEKAEQVISEIGSNTFRERKGGRGRNTITELCLFQTASSS